MNFNEAFKWKPSASQRKAFAQRMKDPDEQAAYEKRKQDKADKRRSGSKFDYETAGGHYVPTKAQCDFATNDKHLAKTSEEKAAFNDVIFGYGANEKVHHDSIHIVNEKMRSQTESYMKKITESNSRRANDFFGDSKHGQAIDKILKGTWNDKKVVTEARDNVYATYTQLKDRVIAKISAQKASVFTALAKQWKELESYLSELEIKKRELNELKNKVDAMETAAKSKIRDKIVEVFDDSEQTMTLVVECLGSSFTLSKLTDANLPSTKTVSTTDYEKVVNLLLEQLPDLKSQVDILLKQCTAIQTVDVKGKERSVRVGISESIITEGAFDKLKQWFINLKSKFLQAFDRSKFRQKKISQLLNNLKQTNENKITASEFKQMIREIIASELNKR
jgi:hypothetical protein